MLTDVLADRLRVEPTAPLVTCYGHDRFERSEFSARSLINWVNKTANLIVDEYDLDEDDRIALPVLSEHPHHWMSWIWALAAWRVGCEITDSPAGVDGADVGLVVGGPEQTRTAAPTLACSLHPMGMPLAGTADGVEDFVSEVRSQPDAWVGMDPSASAQLWQGATWAELVDGLEHDTERRLIQPADGRAAMMALLSALPRGSVVAAPVDLSADDVAKIVESEKASR